MMDKKRRNYSRFIDHVPILYAGYDSKSYDKAVMRNSCSDGMYFESDFAPDPGTDIFIGIEKSPYSAGHDVYRARVMWVKELPKKASFFYYGVGVRYY